MSSEGGYYWLFVESKSRVLSKRLTQKEAEDFLVGLTEKDINSWWAWNPLLRDWLSLKKIVDLKDAKLRLLMTLPPNTSASKNKNKKREEFLTSTTHIPDSLTDVKDFLRDEAMDEIRDFHGDDLSPSSVPRPPKLGLDTDRRKADRLSKKVEVIVASGSKVFRTNTINVSDSGVLLEKAIPPDLKSGPFEIVFIIFRGGVKKQLVFQGQVLGDAVDRRRLNFGSLNKGNANLLEEIKSAD